MPKPTTSSSLPPENWLSDELSPEDLKIYLPPSKEEMDKIQVKEFYFSYFENWKPEHHYEMAKKFTGFKPNSVRSEGTYTNFASLDDKTDGFHYYMMFIKQGIGRATSDAAHQTRHGIITRDEGVDLVLEYDGEYPSLYSDIFLDYIDMSINELNQIFDKFRRPVLWEQHNQQWKLKHQMTKFNFYIYFSNKQIIDISY